MNRYIVDMPGESLDGTEFEVEDDRQVIELPASGIRAHRVDGFVGATLRRLSAPTVRQPALARGH